MLRRNADRVELVAAVRVFDKLFDVDNVDELDCALVDIAVTVETLVFEWPKE